MAPLQSSTSPKQWKLSEMSAPIPASVKLQPADNVIIATRALQPGDQAGNLQVRDNIPAGHKIAERDIKQGEALIKFGQTIGFAITDIQAGSHVHSHNMEFSDPGVHHSFCKDYKQPNTQSTRKNAPSSAITAKTAASAPATTSPSSPA